MTIQCDHVIEARRPDIVFVEKKNNRPIIVDIASSWDHRVYEKEGEKIEKYQDLKREIGRLRGIRHLEVIPVVVRALYSSILGPSPSNVYDDIVLSYIISMAPLPYLPSARRTLHGLL